MTETLLAPAETRSLASLGDYGWFRRAVILIALAAIWEGYARYLGNALLLPSFSATLQALYEGIASGELIARTAATLTVLGKGYALGILVSAVLALFAITNRWGGELLNVLTAMFNPLPAVALLPIALLWFGLGEPSLVFVIIHAVTWPLSLNVLTGFRAVPPTLRMAGRNLGLGGVRFAIFILIPAAFPSILAGLKIAWAFAWRTLIAAELVFGVGSRSGGLGWFIYVNRNQLETANVFAGLLVITLIGLIVESLLFRSITRLTVERWGQQD
ncbi:MULTISPECIES: ABC transporter permease [Rhodomicrobium]|uniref:ABC transporter permease n=1 Tax=Rhodomicrobium TaxID=1068 RepID=UPI000B4C196F|nr:MULTISPECIES: ABC transporter permease [Rhodomicrobium]